MFAGPPPWGSPDSIDVEIAALTWRQNEIFWAYASEARRAAWIAGEPERQAAKRKAWRIYQLDTLRWLGATEAAIAALPEPAAEPEPPPDPLDTPTINVAFRRLFGARSDKAYDKHLARFEKLCAEARA